MNSVERFHRRVPPGAGSLDHSLIVLATVGDDLSLENVFPNVERRYQHEYAATTPASVDEVNIAVCLLLDEDTGKLVCLPVMAKCIPVVERCVVWQFAKDASDKNVHSSSSGSSPMYPACR